MAESPSAEQKNSSLDPKNHGAYFVPCSEVQNNRNLVTGFAAPGFEKVKDLLEYSIKIGDDVGAGVAAFVDGELKVNLYGGHATENRHKPYDEESLSLVFSCSKPVAHVVVAIFVDRKLLAWDDLVTKYWPEFGVGNKENVTIGDIVRHRGGIGWFDCDITLDDTEDLDRFAVKLANQEHNWGGTPTQSYSGMTGGYYLNEIIRRADPQHRTIGKILVDDILPRLGSAGWTPEFYFTLPEELEPRLSPFIGYPKFAFLLRLFAPKWLWTPSEGFGILHKFTRSSVSGSKNKTGNISADSINADEISKGGMKKKAKSNTKLFKGKSINDVSVADINSGATGAQKGRVNSEKSKSSTTIAAIEAVDEDEVVSPVFRQMLNKNSVAGKSLNHSTPVKDFPAGYNNRRVRKSEHPSFSGVTNARSLATIAAMMAQGGSLNGQTILSKETATKANEIVSTEYDQCLLTELTITHGGWAVNSFKDVPGEWQGWSGAGGSLILWEPQLKVGFAFVMNAMQLNIMADHRGIRLLKAIMAEVTRTRLEVLSGTKTETPAATNVLRPAVMV